MGIFNRKKKRDVSEANFTETSFQINTERCIGCGECEMDCPAEAINLDKGYAQIDEKICTKCMACIDSCPTNAIFEG